MSPLHMAAGCVLVAAIAGSAGYWRGHTAGEAKVQAAWDRERAQLAEEHAKAMAAAREKEQALQANADQLRTEMNNELKTISQRSASAIDSLRKRAERPPEGSAVSSTTSSGQSGCTPRELYRQDAEVAVRLAREADELAAALKQCYAQYETLRH